MLKLKTVIFAVFALFVVATPAFAASGKYTFNDVNINGATVEIEATVRATKNPYSQCTYYSDNYVNYLGAYGEAVNAGSTAQTVLDFCVTHFADKK